MEDWLRGRLKRLLKRGTAIEDIAKQFRCPANRVLQMIEEYRLTPEELRRRERQQTLPFREPDDSPTEEEIWGVLTLQIRAGWSEEEEQKRRVGWRTHAWRAPNFKIAEIFPRTT